MRKTDRAALVQVPVKVQNVAFDNSDPTPEDLVGCLPRNDFFHGPIWVCYTGFGWLVVDRDPQVLAPTTPAWTWNTDLDAMNQDKSTWKEQFTDDPYVQELTSSGTAVFEKFDNVDEFAAADDTIRFICSYDDAQKPEIKQALSQAGFTKAAEHVDEVEF